MKGSSLWVFLLIPLMLLTGPLAPVSWAEQPAAGMPAPPAPGAKPAPLPDSVYEAGAGVATAVNIPMRGVLCAAGGVLGFAALVVTFGSGYRFATAIVEEGCSGPWTITPDHLKGTVRPAEARGYN